MIKIITNNNEKSQICLKILKALPKWFGIEQSILDYAQEVKSCYFVSYEINSQSIAFIAIKENPVSYDIHVMGILEEFHRQGIGYKLIKFVEEFAKMEKKKYMTVKTLSEENPDINYKKTREFYLSLAYEPLETLRTLWDEHNPCLYMIKSL